MCCTQMSVGMPRDMQLHLDRQPGFNAAALLRLWVNRSHGNAIVCHISSSRASRIPLHVEHMRHAGSSQVPTGELFLEAASRVVCQGLSRL